MSKVSSDTEDEEVKRVLDERFAPVHTALSTWGRWSRVKSRLFQLAMNDYPQACVWPLTDLVLLLRSCGHGHVFAEIGLIKPVYDLIKMLATDPPLIEEATRELERLNESSDADDVRYEIRQWLPTLLSVALRLEERLLNGCLATNEAGAAVIRGGSLPKRNVKSQRTEAEYATVAYYPKAAVVRLMPEGIEATISERRLIDLLRRVLDQAPREVRFEDLAAAPWGGSGRADSSARVDGSSDPGPRPLVASTYERYARDIRNALGMVGHYWNNDGSGARFDLPVRAE